MHSLKRDKANLERDALHVSVVCGFAQQMQFILKQELLHLKDSIYTLKISMQKLEIDLLRCLVVEEACPKGAIYLDGTGEMAADNREDLVLTKERMTEKTGGPIHGIRN